MLNITTRTNHLTNDGSLYFATEGCEKISFNDFLIDMAKNTALETADLRSAFQLFKDNLIAYLCKGKCIETPIGTFRPSVKGTIASKSDDFNHRVSTNDHSVRIKFRVHKDLSSKVAANIRINRLSGSTTLMPEPEAVSTKYRPEGEAFQAHDMIKLIGEDLKFDEEQIDEGIFLENEAGVELRINHYHANTPKQLLFVLPPVDAGSYTLHVRTRMGNHVLRVNKLKESINVA